MIDKVMYIFRKSHFGFYSIENVFDSIIPNSVYQNSRFYVKHKSAYPIKILKNILSFNKKKFNIVHITGDVNYMALVFARNKILTIHDVDSIIKGSVLSKLYFWFFWFFIPIISVKKITVISEFTKKQLLKKFPFIKNKVVVIPNPVDKQFVFSKYNFNAQNPNILLIGTKENKNLENVIIALSKIKCNLTIIGKLTKSQSQLLCKFNIEYKNFMNISSRELVDKYNNCDIVSFVSKYEGFGLPIIEAQTVGRPVITSNIGAMKEVAGNTAKLVNPFDIYSIRDGFVEVIEVSDLRNELIVNGLKNSQKYQPIHIAKMYDKLYKSVLIN